jgi:hypothetical protein
MDALFVYNLVITQFLKFHIFARSLNGVNNLEGMNEEFSFHASEAASKKYVNP